MNYNILFNLLFVLLFASEALCENPNGLSLDPVKIYGVSTMIDGQDNFGSITGGTYIYIRIVGHDLTPSNNKITVGPYDCIIPEKGVNENTITCETTNAFDP